MAKEAKYDDRKVFRTIKKLHALLISQQESIDDLKIEVTPISGGQQTRTYQFTITAKDDIEERLPNRHNLPKKYKKEILSSPSAQSREQEVAEEIEEVRGGYIETPMVEPIISMEADSMSDPKDPHGPGDN